MKKTKKLDCLDLTSPMNPIQYPKEAPPLPPSIYFGGCAFGAAFCKIFYILSSEFD
jgi:hypothetical protein